MSDKNDIGVAMYNLFERDALGQKVFDALVARFYDSELFVAGDPHSTAYAIGQRDVIKYIINKMKFAQLPQDNSNDIQEE